MSDKTQPIALEERNLDGDRLFSPSADRNKDAVRDAFVSVAPEDGDILEVGAGTGEHAVHFAAVVPALHWRPGDPDAASRASIAAWTAHSGLSNIAAPHAIDVAQNDWLNVQDASLAGMVSLNMIHIAPFEAAIGLFKGAGRYLRPQGILFLYGPFSRDGVHTAASNADFDRNLKSRNPRWGVRDLNRDLDPLARKAGLTLDRVIDMPANNASCVFRKA